MPPRPQNSVLISPALGQYTINADASVPLLASAAVTVVTHQQTVIIIVLSCLLGLAVVCIMVGVV